MYAERNFPFSSGGAQFAISACNDAEVVPYKNNYLF